MGVNPSQEKVKEMENHMRELSGILCDICLGDPTSGHVDRKCICTFSDRPGKYVGMVEGMRHHLMLLSDYIAERDLLNDFESWRARRLTPSKQMPSDPP